MPQIIVTSETLSSLKKELSSIHSKQQLSLIYSPDQQMDMLQQLTDCFIEHVDDEKMHLQMLNISYILSKHSYTESGQEQALNILSLSLVSKIGMNTKSIQNKLISAYIDLLTISVFQQHLLGFLVQSDFLALLDSSYKDIRFRSTLYVCDVKSHPQFNLLCLSKELQTKAHLTSLLTNMTHMILDGPKEYPCTTPEHGSLTSYDVLQRFLNQFIHGKLGLKGTHDWEDYRNNVIEALIKLIIFKEKGKEAYREKVQRTCIKALMSHIQHLEKQAKQVLSNPASTATELVTFSSHLGQSLSQLKQLDDTVQTKTVSSAIQQLEGTLSELETRFDNT